MQYARRILLQRGEGHLFPPANKSAICRCEDAVPLVNLTPKKAAIATALRYSFISKRESARPTLTRL